MLKPLRPALLLLCLGLPACGQSPDSSPERTGIRLLAQAPQSDAFARASVIREFEFPRDHGHHSEFATEWWYFTGNLESSAGRHFGFELTFFRYALSASAAQRASAWGSNQAWLAHFALTDTANDRIYLDERLGRGALGIAGASPDTLDVHVKDWSARQLNGDGDILLEAQTRETGMQLRLTQTAAVALHGDRGLDRKGREPGNASYYYSIPRLRVAGTVSTPDGESHDVGGSAWLDREWATSSLDPGVEGWDWFGLQLDDGDNLMLYRLRNSDGSMNEFSSGTLMRADGTSRVLEPASVDYRAVRHWRSPASGIRYPVQWMISIPELALEFDVEPRIDDQEINLGLRYWEGAVTLSGTSAGTRITGVGYLELAGYR